MHIQWCHYIVAVVEEMAMAWLIVEQNYLTAELSNIKTLARFLNQTSGGMYIVAITDVDPQFEWKLTPYSAFLLICIMSKKKKDWKWNKKSSTKMLKCRQEFKIDDINKVSTAFERDFEVCKELLCTLFCLILITTLWD